MGIGIILLYLVNKIKNSGMSENKIIYIGISFIIAFITSVFGAFYGNDLNTWFGDAMRLVCIFIAIFSGLGGIAFFIGIMESKFGKNK